MLSTDTCERHWEKGRLMLAPRPAPLSSPHADMAVINNLGKDDDDNDHN